MPPAAEPQLPKPPFEAKPAQRLYHLLIAVAGWALFVYWWVVVLVERASHRQIMFTLLFIGIVLALCLLVTGAWTLHNLRISRSKRARYLVPAVREEYTQDALGNPLVFEGGMEAVREDPVVQIRFENDTKYYRPSSVIKGRMEGDRARDPIASPSGQGAP